MSSPHDRGEGDTVRHAIAAAAQALSSVSDTPRLDAELLAAYALNLDREALILGYLDAPAPFAFDDLVARRLAHEPVAYITGRRDFWTLSLNVAPGVLIPRPDSETLIEAAIDHFGDRAPRSVLDLGTGSGALLLAALSHWPEAAGIGVDQSPIALEIAQGNAARIGLGARALFREGNWAGGIEATFDLVLCNPPYVESDADLAPEVSDHEPHEALFAGADGLDDYRRLAPQIVRLIAPAGLAALEIGADQAAAVSQIFAAFPLNIKLYQDLGGRDRCLVMTKKG